jgi:hypothetical protein
VVVTAAADKEGRDGARGGRLTGKWKEPVVCKTQAGLGSQERTGLYGLEFSFRLSLIMETEVSGLYGLECIVFDLAAVDVADGSQDSGPVCQNFNYKHILFYPPFVKAVGPTHGGQGTCRLGKLTPSSQCGPGQLGQ